MPWWAPFWTWLKKVPGEIWFVVVALAAGAIGIYIVDKNAVKRTKQKQENKELRDTIELQATAKEVTDEIEQRVEEADVAIGRLPQFKSASELRRLDPSLASIILGDPERHER